MKNTVPENLSIVLKWSNNVITIFPILLNKKDSFSIQCLINNYKDFHIVERIIGVNDIVEKTTDNEYTKYIIILGLGLMCIGIPVYIGIAIFFREEFLNYMNLLMALYISGFIIMFLPTIWDINYRRTMFSSHTRSD